MESRTLLAIVLSLIILIGYQYFFLKPQPREQQPTPQQQEEARQETVTGEGTVTAPEETIAPAAIKKPIKVTEDTTSQGADVTVRTPLYTAVFNTKGAGLTSFRLNHYRSTVNADSEPIELVDVHTNMTLPLSVTFPESSITVPAEVIYETDASVVDLTQSDAPRDLIFSWTYPGEVEIHKAYTFHPDRYAFELEVRILNLSGETLKENALLRWTRYHDPEVKQDRYSHEGPVGYVQDDFISRKLNKLDETEFLGPGVSWGGYEEKYFIAALISEQPSLTSLVISKNGENMISTGLEGPRNIVPPGQSASYRYTLYVGPKDYDLLKAQGVGLEDSINFGSWIKWLALPLLKVLNYINDYVHNYGIAIIILTILIKLIFWPLGNMSYKSMKEMQKLQPKIKELQEKFKEDKAKLQQATMELYKSHKVNPMGGCLPIFIQIPVFFGLYRALLYAIELRHAPFYFWIQDLSAKDPYYITPIIMGATMFLQQKMSPAPGGNEMQQKMMMWLPVIFTFLFLNFPSGLVIYWLFNNILSIGQQYYINSIKS